MSTLLVKNSYTLVTMDDERREIKNGAIFVRDNVVEQVGTSETLPPTADKVLDLKGRHIVLPGLINTHHHFFQTLTRAVPAAQNCDLFHWLQTLYPIWSKLTDQGGSMSVGESAGGLPPNALVEKESDILKDSQRLIEQYHNNNRHAMTRLVLAPCSPFSVSPALMRESAAMARSYPGVRLHTHLAENKSDVDYSLSTFGLSPGDYAESVG